MLAPPQLPLAPIFRGVAVILAGIALALSIRPAQPPSVAETRQDVPAIWATNIAASGELGEWRPGMSAEAKPFKGQKRSPPPCAKGVEVEYNGACWVPHKVRPPCPPGLYEGDGNCLLPVKAEPPHPVSVRQ